MHLMFTFSTMSDPELEDELQKSSHLYVIGPFGWVLICSPCYWETCCWRALQFRNQRVYFFFELLCFVLHDLAFGT